MAKPSPNSKTSQLQIRISPQEKELVIKAAKREGFDVSTWVLKKLLNANQEFFFGLVKKLSSEKDPRYLLSELNNFINNLSPKESELVFKTKPEGKLSAYLSNYLAAMIEHAAIKKNFSIPKWTQEIKALKVAHFETTLETLRLYLLINSPVSFRKRGIFLDSTIGDQV